MSKLLRPEGCRCEQQRTSGSRACSCGSSPGGNTRTAGKTREIPLTQGYVAVVDEADFEWLAQFKWGLGWNRKHGGNKYARRHARPRLMHRLILGAPVGLYVDHINGDGLDNRRVNLRLVTPQQNQWNRRAVRGGESPYKGVSRDSKTGRWTASLSGFASEDDAGRAVDAMALLLHGEYALLNFPHEGA